MERTEGKVCAPASLKMAQVSSGLLSFFSFYESVFLFCLVRVKTHGITWSVKGGRVVSVEGRFIFSSSRCPCLSFIVCVSFFFFFLLLRLSDMLAGEGAKRK